MKSSIIFLVFLLLAILFIYTQNKYHNNQDDRLLEETITIGFMGDTMLGRLVNKVIKKRLLPSKS